jgi:DNA-binding transcriptional MerR regulator
MPPLLAFTSQHVQRLTGLSPRVLRYWEETGVFHASYVDDCPRRPYRRLYTFRDVVALRTLSLLRREHRIGLDELRKVGAFLAEHRDAPWASLRFRVAGRHVVFDDPEAGVPVTGKPLRQAVIPIDLDDIARETEADAARLRERLPDDFGRVVRHRYINHNAWVIAGTRIPTTAIWNFHEAGFDTDAIIREYPQLRPVDVAAAIAHETQRLERRAA